MEQLYKLKDVFIGYLSPKRRRTVGPSTPSNQLSAEHHFYEPTSEPQGQKSQAALRNRINIKHHPQPDTRFGPGSRKRAREDEYDLAGRGTHHASFEISPDESASQIALVDESETESLSDPPTDDEQIDELEEELEEDFEEEDIEEEEVSPEDKVAEYLARQAELALRKEAIAEVKAKGGWHPNEVFLFERLSMRSFEEVFPADWKVEFPTLSAELFTRVQKSTFVNYNCKSSHAGHKALQRIFELGWRVKDKADLNLPTEKFMAREIKKYIEWSEKDGGYYKLRFIPVLTVVTARPREGIESISKHITDQMDFLAEKHRETLSLPSPQKNDAGEIVLYSRTPPLLYGIIVAQTKAIFVTLDSSDPDAKLRHIAHVDLKEEGHSVWNGLAIAIVAVVARNYMMSIKDDFEEEEEYTSSDPDA